MADVSPDRVSELERQLETLADEAKRMRASIELLHAELAELRAAAPVPTVPFAPPPRRPATPAPVATAPAAPARRAPAPAAARPPAAPPPPPAKPKPPGPSLRDRLEAADLLGARGLALAGGAVTLLGVVFFFVLAANRGWIGPGARVACGAVVSAALVGAGALLRARYGRTEAGLAAIATGLAGAYATLAAATMLYELLPAWGALLAATAIAATGTGFALAWSSEPVAVLALLGAETAPALLALDEGVSTASVGFALVVGVAAAAVATWARWLWLLALAGAVFAGQLGWLVAETEPVDAGATVLAGLGALAVLAAGIGWQARSASPELEPAAAAAALASAGIALAAAPFLFETERQQGVALLAAAGVAALAAALCAQSLRDLAQVVAAAALLLAGVATADVLSGGSLAIAWSIQAVALALVGNRLRSPRYSASALVYLAAALAHVLVVQLGEGTEAALRDAAPALFVAAGAALGVGLLLPATRRDRAAAGLLASLEPFWDSLVTNRVALRAALAAIAFAFAASGAVALASGRTLTIVWAAEAAAIALAAAVLRERRLQPFALAALALALAHALTVEAPPNAILQAEGANFLAPVPSLAALAAAFAIVAWTAPVEEATRLLRILGPPEGPELALQAAMSRAAAPLREGLAMGAAAVALDAAGLLLVDAAYDAGQVAASSLWAVAGLAAATWLAPRSRPVALTGAWLIGVAGFAKAIGFDAVELSDRAGAWSLLLTGAAIVLLGFATCWLAAGAFPFDVTAGLTALLGIGPITRGLERLLGDGWELGVALGGVAIAYGALAAPPLHEWRTAAEPRPWARGLAAAYWLLGLAALIAAVWLVARDEALALAVYAVLAVALALLGARLGEPWLWLAGAAVLLAATIGGLSVVTPPTRLVDASAHPATGLWALALAIAAWFVLARLLPELPRLTRAQVLVGAAALTLYAVSLGVLEAAERISTASVETDFQRGHAAVTAVWGLAALALVAAGLLTDRAALRWAGLALFGLALAKLFLYDLRSLSSITRALSFLAVGTLLLAAAFFVQRLTQSGGGDKPHGPTAGEA